jgi:DNA repair protein RadC
VAPLLRHQMILHINIEDVVVTRAIVEAGKLLGIEVLDHLIIGNNRFVSLKARGFGFS